MKYQHSTMIGESSCPTDDVIKMAQAERERESTCTKQQVKA
jgi:hypothetical protein